MYTLSDDVQLVVTPLQIKTLLDYRGLRAGVNVDVVNTTVVRVSFTRGTTLSLTEISECCHTEKGNYY